MPAHPQLYKLLLYIIYSYEQDKRNLRLPYLFTKQKYIILAYWKNDDLQQKLEKKFNIRGFVIFDKNDKNEYDKLLFGSPINFIKFVNLIKKGLVIFDSGMFENNNRKYSQFRAGATIWKQLID